MEFLILSSLSFDLSFPTSFRFLERYMRMLGEDQSVMMMSLFLMELALIELRMIQYPSSIIAAAALCQSYKMITRKLHPEALDCEKKIESHIKESLGVTKDSDSLQKFIFCCKELQILHVRSLTSSLQAVRKKYQAPEYSMIHPYIFI